MPLHPYGNDPAKIEGYKAFWQRSAVKRPLIGFSVKSWFPLEEFGASRAWQSHDLLTPDMVKPDAFLADQERLLREGEAMDDDILRGASPSQAVFWECGMLGSRIRILPGSTMAEEQTLPWEIVRRLHVDPANPWFRKYLEFADALVTRARGQFPVSHGTLVGPTDLLAVFRGHTRSIMDLIDEPEESRNALWQFAAIFKELTETIWQRLPRFCNGYFDAQYQLWTEGPIIRMQEDAVAVYSPELYRKFVQPVDRYLAKQFAGSFIHLHSTSMFLLDAFLEIEELHGYEVNYEPGSGGPPIAGMIPYFRRIQKAGKPLLVRGAFTPAELRLLLDALEPAGLYVYLMVADMKEVERLRPVAGL
ncbi:MAG: hypothetical protein LLG97_17875 [Deltaproteobacteria bacterium]|nr:hypothetical protein [Deltaproteobacteria bacterium]